MKYRHPTDNPNFIPQPPNSDQKEAAAFAKAYFEHRRKMKKKN